MGQVPGNFHYGFSVVTESGIGRGIALPHVSDTDLGQSWHVVFDFLTKLGFLSFYSFSLTLIDALDTLLVSVSSVPFPLGSLTISERWILHLGLLFSTHAHLDRGKWWPSSLFRLIYSAHVCRPQNCDRPVEIYLVGDTETLMPSLFSEAYILMDTFRDKNNSSN